MGLHFEAPVLGCIGIAGDMKNGWISFGRRDW
jgi:hypothetical protein